MGKFSYDKNARPQYGMGAGTCNRPEMEEGIWQSLKLEMEEG